LLKVILGDEVYGFERQRRCGVPAATNPKGCAEHYAVRAPAAATNPKGCAEHYAVRAPAAATNPKGCAEHYAVRAPVRMGGIYHIGSLQGLPHTRCVPTVPLLLAFYNPR
jgi:hypothetical protein